MPSIRISNLNPEASLQLKQLCSSLALFGFLIGCSLNLLLSSVFIVGQHVHDGMRQMGRLVAP